MPLSLNHCFAVIEILYKKTGDRLVLGKKLGTSASRAEVLLTAPTRFCRMVCQLEAVSSFRFVRIVSGSSLSK